MTLSRTRSVLISGLLAAVTLLGFGSMMATPALAQRTHPDFLFLERGNTWVYEVNVVEDYEEQRPFLLSFDIQTTQRINDRILDYIVQVRYSGGDVRQRTATCRYRTQLDRVYLIGVSGQIPDCHFQSPLVIPTLETVQTGAQFEIGQDQVSVDFIGKRDDYWSNEQGGGGHILHRFAPGIGLYYYENERIGAQYPSEESSRTWKGTLIYARVGERTWGEDPSAPSSRTPSIDSDSP